jgi:hypothetical protein
LLPKAADRRPPAAAKKSGHGSQSATLRGARLGGQITFGEQKLQTLDRHLFDIFQMLRELTPH